MNQKDKGNKNNPIFCVLLWQVDLKWDSLLQARNVQDMLFCSVELIDKVCSSKGVWMEELHWASQIWNNPSNNKKVMGIIFSSLFLKIKIF